MTGTHAAEAGEREELRIALVMNGGVSLAVWMGGVTRELDRVRRAEGVYGKLLDLTDSDARIDVIAGASAGGINGAVLALAIARGTTVEAIRQLWMTDGAIDLLLRDPMERDAPSVLQGDGQLLARLHDAMAAIGENPEPPDPSAPRPPLHLSITGTILKGEVTTYPDLFGAMIPDVTHAALFQFKRPGVPAVSDGERDDFAPPEQPAQPDLAAARLALAARSSASFPGAFEPSFVPVDAARDVLHPAMGDVADFDSDRWVIDGGVLVNTPFQPALDAIKGLAAERPVRRVLGYVVPNPAAPEPSPDAAVPSAGEVVLDAVSRLPRVQSVGRELAEIEASNDRVRHRRAARTNALLALDSDELDEAAELLLPAYLLTRRATATEDIVDALVAGSGAHPYPTTEQVAALRAHLLGLDGVPWLPGPARAAGLPELPVSPWRWGYAPVENAANLALDLLVRMVRLPDFGPGRRRLHGLRRDLHGRLRELRGIGSDSTAYWRGGSESVFLHGRTTELVAGWATFAERLEPVALGIAEDLTAAADAMSASDAAGAEADALREMLGRLGRGSTDATLRGLLALDVVQRASGADLGGIEQAVELVLMSADAPNAVGLPARAEGKLAGLQAGHFGAFYKSSWRANDWMWGRLDGADRLVRTLLDPRRVQRRVRSRGVDETTREIRAIACESATPELSDYLGRRWADLGTSAAVERELEELRSAPDDPPLTALASSYAAIRRRVQVEIAVAEIPGVASAVAADRDAGANAESPGSQWERRFPAGRPLTVDQAVTALQECPVGGETIAGEIGSDLFTKVATKGGAVIGSVLTAALPAFKLLKPPLVLIRGLLLTLFLLGRGVTEGSRTGGFLVALTLAIGGALVAVFAVGTHVPGLLLLLGVAILVAGVLLALLRRQTRAQFALTALVFFGSAAAYYAVRSHDQPRWVDAVAVVLAVALMTGAATMLGLKGKSATRPGSA